MSFEFEVSEPLRKEGAKTLDVGFWAYKITARTSLSQYKNNAMVAIRRFSDFDWFRNQLVLTYPGYIVPPVPNKDFNGALQNFSHEGRSPLLHFRQRNLLRFLMRVGAHSVLGPSRLLQDFLELSETDWALRMKNGKAPQESSTSLLTRTIAMKFSSLTSSSAPPEPFASTTNLTLVNEYLHELEKSLLALKSKINENAYIRTDGTKATREFGKALVKLSRLTDMYDDPELLRAMGEVGENTMNISAIGLQQSRMEVTQLSESVQYYIGVCGAIREELDLLAKEKKELAYINQSLYDAKTSKLKAEASGNAGAVAKQDQAIQALVTQRDGKKKDVQQFEAIFTNEVSRIHHEKLYDFHQLFRCFGDIQVEYADKMSCSWSSVTRLLETNVTHRASD